MTDSQRSERGRETLVADLEVLAGRLDGAFVAGRVLSGSMCRRGLLEVQGEGRRRFLHLRSAEARWRRHGGGGPPVGGNGGRRLGGLRRPSLFCEGAQIDLHSH